MTSCMCGMTAALSVWMTLSPVGGGHALIATGGKLALSEHRSHPPAVLVFENPANGSSVHASSIQLTYALKSAREGRALTSEDLNTLREDGVSMCFEIHGAFSDFGTCAPLSMQTVLVDRPQPGVWHTITATLHDGGVTATTDSEVARVWKEDPMRLLDGAGDTLHIFIGITDMPAASTTPMCGESACLDSSDLRSAYYDRVYRGEFWGETRSGGGSTLSAAQNVLQALEEVIRHYGIESILDAPCGDLTWMPHVHGIDQVRYTGVDISVSAVQENQRKFPGGGGAGKRHAGEGRGEGGAVREGGFQGAVFLQADLVEGVPPSTDGKPYDLIFIRDVMIHLPPRHNLRILENVEASGARFVMMSTYLDGDDNWESNTFVPLQGHFINLSLAPYCLRPPVALFPDVSFDRTDQRMGLWELDPARPLVVGSGDCSQVDLG